MIYGNEFQELNKKNKEFYIQDRYGILAAFYPPDVCAEYLDAPMMKPFVTNTMVLRQVIAVWLMVKTRSLLRWNIVFTHIMARRRLETYRVIREMSRATTKIIFMNKL